MPCLEEHCRHTKERYGYEFREIHSWMDETVKMKGPNHREDRHDPFKTPEKAKEIFWEQVPSEYRKFIPDAVLDHIRLDYEEESNSEEDKRKQKSELIRRHEVNREGLRVGNKVKYDDREYRIKERQYDPSTGYFYFYLESDKHKPIPNVREDHIECTEPLIVKDMIEAYEEAYEDSNPADRSFRESERTSKDQKEVDSVDSERGVKELTIEYFSEIDGVDRNQALILLENYPTLGGLLADIHLKGIDKVADKTGLPNEIIELVEDEKL